MPEAAAESLKQRLDRLQARYGPDYLGSDPVVYPRMYSGDRDREVIAFLTAALAYGRVAQIQRSVERLCAILGPAPAEFVAGFTPARDRRALARFVHRFNDGDDIALLIHYMKQMIARSGSIEDFFLEGYRRSDEDIGPALSSFVRRALSLDCAPWYRGGRLPKRAGVRYFLPSPEAGSSCKRLNLFLRWMVRPDDGVDFGIWKRVRPAQLVIPLDTHVMRIAGYLGLTRRRTPGWAMAAEVTHRLRRLDPEDPVKYDFALCRLGILDACPRRRDPAKCVRCDLETVCALP